MNIAVIFAGGSGKRMHAKSRPKQFLELNGKPIIIYTLELFDNHREIDAIIVSCIEEWIPFLEKMIRKFDITKVMKIVPGGKNSQESIYKGLLAAKDVAGVSEDSIVLIHDGVRPLITEETISDNIQKVKEEGSCITCIPSTETFIVDQGDGTYNVPIRERSLVARAPQSFYLDEMIEAHAKAQQEGKDDFIDSCSLMTYYGKKLGIVFGPVENIKITTPMDFYMFRALVEVHENQQIFGF